jgi:hypothetical protein
VARHAATRSELVARTWRAARLVNKDDCERQARLWRPEIPDVPPDSVLETRRIDAPPGFTTELRVGAAPLALTREIRGYALAFGTMVGRCYALVYTTIDGGAGAEASVGRRLAVVADEIVPQVRFLSIEERVRQKPETSRPSAF